MKKVLIIGGGISGLTAAYLLGKEEGFEVHIVEKNDRLGGLLQSFSYKESGLFDYGAHNILETNIDEIDDFFLNLFPIEKWQISNAINGQRRALTGLVYNSKFNEKSPFIDLQNNEKQKEYIADFFMNIENVKDNIDFIDKSAYELSSHLFGSKITDEVIEPALFKLYKTSGKELNSMVMYLTQFSRIGLLGENVMEELVYTNKIASRLSYPNQKKLPEKFVSKQNAYYPKDYGISKVIDAIEERLIKGGVFIHKSSEVTNLNIKNNTILDVDINDKKYEFDLVINSVGFNNIANMLKLDIPKYSYNKAPKTVISNFLISKPLNAGEVCFIYCYDKGSEIFRIDNYPNYSEGAKRDGFYAIGIESLKFENFDKSELQDALLKELEEYNLIDKKTEVKFRKTEILDYGFPLLTQNNIEINNIIREKVENQKINNLVNIGILSEKGLFFENDVIKDVYKKIKEIRDAK